MSKIKKNFTKKNIIIISIILGSILLLIGFYFLLKPNINLKGNDIEVIKVSNEYIEKGASGKSIINLNKNKISISGKVNYKKVGKYKITYKIENFIFTTTKVREIEVVDKDKPVINLNGNTEAFICPNTEYQEEGYSASDNYDGDLTKKVKVINEKNYIKYVVEDSSKNLFTIKRNIKIEDKTSPIITLNNGNYSISEGNKYVEKGYSAIDNCDGDISKNVNVSGTINTSVAGKYTLTYKVSDNAGNSTAVDRIITVYKKKQSSLSPASPNGSVIYLTFDDGPSASITPKLLDILKEEGAKATFFVIGKASGLDYLIKREHDEGHGIGIHGNSHNYATIYANEEAFFNSVYTLRDKVYNLTGEYSNIIRFPGGSSNTVSRKYNSGIMSRLTTQVMEKGFVYFDWNIGSNDTTNINSTQIVNNVLNGISPTKVNVVLMHDFENNYKTLNAIRDIIIQGKNKGYTFEKLTTNVPQVKHGVAN